MKLKKYILIGSVLYLIYKTGEIKGHMTCLDNLAKKYGDAILVDDGKLVDKISKRFILTLCKQGETAKGA